MSLASDDYDDGFTACQGINDQWQAEAEPDQQIASAGVADANPHNAPGRGQSARGDWRRPRLRDDDGSDGNRVGPGVPILGISHAEVDQMLGVASMLGEPTRQRWRTLRIDEESHSMRAKDWVIALLRRVFE